LVHALDTDGVDGFDGVDVLNFRFCDRFACLTAPTAAVSGFCKDLVTALSAGASAIARSIVSAIWNSSSNVRVEGS
jgi:hypothetical protein